MEASETCHLLLFTKYPRAGFAKTRMIPLLGPEGAAQLSKDMSEHIVRVMRSFARVMESKGARVVLRLLYAGDADPADITGWLGEGEGERVEPQAAGNLGARLTRAFEESFERPAGPLKVVVIGSDIPGIDEPLLRESFARLDDSDAVMGPSEDGGYYLLGLRRWAGDVFKDIPWSTDTTGRVQLQRIRECGLTATELRPLADVDNPDDFAVWEQVSGKPASFYRPSDDSVPPT